MISQVAVAFAMSEWTKHVDSFSDKLMFSSMPHYIPGYISTVNDKTKLDHFQTWRKMQNMLDMGS